MTQATEEQVSVERLTKDIANASITLSKTEARFLVDAYYTMQDNRMRSNNQVRALAEINEPHSVIQWLAEQDATLEKQIKRALDKYSMASPLGEWARGIVGIGPIIAAGLLAHIDIKMAPTAGHIWAFAGLDPTKTWNKGERRPWNASLKTLCWKVGESFVKVKSNEDDFYGKIYQQRKDFEHAKNEAGDYAEQAARVIKARPTHKQKSHYESGKLPDGHIHARAKRYAVKLFLAHYHDQAYRLELGMEPPLPYAIAILGHAHMIDAPN